MAQPTLTIRIRPDPAEAFPGDPKTVAKAQVAAINRSLATGATAINRRIRSELVLSRDFVARLISVTKATPARVAGRIEIKSGARAKEPGIPLGKFGGARQTKRGVTIKVRRGKPKELVRGGFLATMKSGREGIWHRARQFDKNIKARRGPRRQELPIFERFGPTPTGYLENAPGALQQEMDKLGDTLSKNAASQIQRFLAKKK